MSFGAKFLMALVIMGILFTIIVLLVESIVLRWFLIGLSVTIVLSFVNNIGNKTKK